MEKSLGSAGTRVREQQMVPRFRFSEIRRHEMIGLQRDNMIPPLPES